LSTNLARFSVDFGFIPLCTSLGVDWLGFFSCNVSVNAISESVKMLSPLAHRMLRDHVHLWITFVFVSNTCVSLSITKTPPEDHATLFAFHALRLRFTICILVYCTIARMLSFSGQCERLSRRLVLLKKKRSANKINFPRPCSNESIR
jgi:hypothetical protein